MAASNPWLSSSTNATALVEPTDWADYLRASVLQKIYENLSDEKIVLDDKDSASQKHLGCIGHSETSCVTSPICGGSGSSIWQRNTIVSEQELCLGTQSERQRLFDKLASKSPARRLWKPPLPRFPCQSIFSAGSPVPGRWTSQEISRCPGPSPSAPCLTAFVASS